MSAHDVVTCILVYLAIGASIWMAMYREPERSRGNVSILAIAAASIGAILLWPAVVAVILGGALKRARR